MILLPERNDCFETYQDLQEIHKVINYLQTGSKNGLSGIGEEIVTLLHSHPLLMMLPKNTITVLLVREADNITLRLRKQITNELFH